MSQAPESLAFVVQIERDQPALLQMTYPSATEHILYCDVLLQLKKKKKKNSVTVI